VGSRGQEIRKQLIAEAQTRVQEAQRLAASNDRSQAAALLREAAEIWPQLPGLEDKRREWVDDYPVLNCAYPELPNQYLPMLAHSPAERHAAALMFESLVRWTNDPVTGPHYTAQLTEGRPIPLERGRSFFLPQCKWSDSADGAVMDMGKTAPQQRPSAAFSRVGQKHRSCFSRRKQSIHRFHFSQPRLLAAVVTDGLYGFAQAPISPGRCGRRIASL